MSSLWTQLGVLITLRATKLNLSGQLWSGKLAFLRCRPARCEMPRKKIFILCYNLLFSAFCMKSFNGTSTIFLHGPCERRKSASLDLEASLPVAYQETSLLFVVYMHLCNAQHVQTQTSFFPLILHLDCSCPIELYIAMWRTNGGRARFLHCW